MKEARTEVSPGAAVRIAGGGIRFGIRQVRYRFTGMTETVLSPLAMYMVQAAGSIATALGVWPTGSLGWARWQLTVVVALQVAALMTETLVSSMFVTATVRFAGSKAMAEGAEPDGDGRRRVAAPGGRGGVAGGAVDHGHGAGLLAVLQCRRCRWCRRPGRRLPRWGLRRPGSER